MPLRMACTDSYGMVYNCRVDDTFPTANTGSRWQELKNNNVFTIGQTYWASNDRGDPAFYMFINDSGSYVGYQEKTYWRQVRCIK